jgi:hypothetical protein
MAESRKVVVDLWKKVSRKQGAFTYLRPAHICRRGCAAGITVKDGIILLRLYSLGGKWRVSHCRWGNQRSSEDGHGQRKGVGGKRAESRTTSVIMMPFWVVSFDFSHLQHLSGSLCLVPDSLPCIATSRGFSEISLCLFSVSRRRLQHT